MTLEEVKMGGLFMFVLSKKYKGDTVLTGIYKKKRKLNDEYWIVGLPNINDEFAARGDSQVVTYDTDNYNAYQSSEVNKSLTF